MLKYIKCIFLLHISYYKNRAKPIIFIKKNNENLKKSFRYSYFLFINILINIINDII